MRDIQDDEDIKKLVHSFYHSVEQDERLGYIFNDFAQVDWEEHLPKMVDFWSNLLFQTRRYKGRPFRRHLPLPVKKEDFSRWYGLFEATTDQHFRGENAEYAKEMAGKIASSFSVRMEMEGKYSRSNNRNNHE
ncbi:hemoglobin [Fodinibius roseus]|uniref:Hemoglobin n=1 Tax=Fodinibius roseus TaxID=1194090 RepID=A0A1M5ASQ5_9BACT|nr:group III truncated hemoglobin [Fodinibius roseus]SHF33263.1 hemoglobin [Fodinibius roseus]